MGYQDCQSRWPSSMVGSVARCSAGALMFASVTGCFSRQELAARAKPARQIPTVVIEPAAPPPGTGRIVLRLRRRPRDGGRGGRACRRKCLLGAAVLPMRRQPAPSRCAPRRAWSTFLPGNHQLLFGNPGDDDRLVATVVAGAKPSIFRAAPTLTTPRTYRGIVLTLETLAYTALLTGLLFAATPDREHASSLRSLAPPMLGGGGLGLGASIAIDFAGRGSIQPGSGVQWVPRDGDLYHAGE